MAKTFEELVLWQDARKLANMVHAAFIDQKDNNFRNQINSAAVSVMNNIAEGFERFSEAEFRRFLQIAKGSNGEVRSMVYLAIDFGYITENKALEITEHCKRIKSEIVKLMNTLVTRKST